MNDILFYGACTALVTPFLDDKINYPMMEQLLKRQIDAGIRAVVLAGTTGESPTLTRTEKLEMIHRAKQYVGKECMIIAGSGSNDTLHTKTFSQEAEEAGADALLVVSPYYNKTTDDGLVTHYTAIAESVSIPIIIYNVPSRTGQNIPVSVYQQLSTIPNIAGVKEACNDIPRITRTINSCHSNFGIWSGNDDLTVPAISLGGHGLISVLSNLLPKEAATMANAALAGDFDTAAAIQCQLQPLIDLLFCEVNPIPVKAAMKLIGLDCGGCRLPLTLISKENEEKLRKILLA